MKIIGINKEKNKISFIILCSALIHILVIWAFYPLYFNQVEVVSPLEKRYRAVLHIRSYKNRTLPDKIREPEEKDKSVFPKESALPYKKLLKKRNKKEKKQHKDKALIPSYDEGNDNREGSSGGKQASSKMLDMSLPKELMFGSKEPASNIFDPDLRRSLEETRENNREIHLENTQHYAYKEGNDTVYVKGTHCYRVKESPDNQGENIWFLPVRCHWVKTESDKIMDGLKESIGTPAFRAR